MYLITDIENSGILHKPEQPVTLKCTCIVYISPKALNPLVVDTSASYVFGLVYFVGDLSVIWTGSALGDFPLIGEGKVRNLASTGSDFSR